MTANQEFRIAQKTFSVRYVHVQPVNAERLLTFSCNLGLENRNLATTPELCRAARATLLLASRPSCGPAVMTPLGLPSLAEGGKCHALPRGCEGGKACGGLHASSHFTPPLWGRKLWRAPPESRREERPAMPVTSKIKVGDSVWLRDNTKGTKEPFVKLTHPRLRVLLFLSGSVRRRRLGSSRR